MSPRFNQSRMCYVCFFRFAVTAACRYINRLFLKVVLLLSFRKFFAFWITSFAQNNLSFNSFSSFNLKNLCKTSPPRCQTPQLFFAFASRPHYFITFIVLANIVKSPYFNPCIPPSLIINLEQTPLSYFCRKVYVQFQRHKQCPIKGVDDKKQITGAFAVTFKGKFLPI